MALGTPATVNVAVSCEAGLASGMNDGSSWADAFQGEGGLQAALGAASSGNVIFVAQGTYKPTAGTSRTASFRLENGVEIYGHGMITAPPDVLPPDVDLTLLYSLDLENWMELTSGFTIEGGILTDLSADPMRFYQYQAELQP